jgi:hypothetical protein
MAKIRNELPLYMFESAAFTNTSYATNARRFYWDASKYTAPTIYLEIVWSVSAGATGYVNLYNVTDAGVVTDSELTTTSTSIVSSRTGALSLTDLKEYSFQEKVSAGGTVTIHGIRVIIIQDSAVLANIETQTSMEYAIDTTSVSYLVLPAYFKYDGSKYDGTVKIYFESYQWSNNASGIAYAALYDMTAGGTLAGSEISVTGTTETRSRSGELTLVSGRVYRLQVKSNNASYAASNRAMRIIIQQSNNPTKTRVYRNIKFNGVTSTTSASYQSGTYQTYHNTSEYDATVSILWEAFLWTAVSGAVRSYSQLYNVTDSAAIGGSEINILTLVGGTYTPAISSPVSLTNAKYYINQYKSGSAGTECQSTAVSLIYDFDWGDVQPNHLMRLMGCGNG